MQWPVHDARKREDITFPSEPFYGKGHHEKTGTDTFEIMEAGQPKQGALRTPFFRRILSYGIYFQDGGKDFFSHR
ncbi:MAG: hypothetical protein Q9M27_04370 [Mariprofundaceae bacterium]|nr:hypothetical protein [Mariprofundaceae bacterium]